MLEVAGGVVPTLFRHAEHLPTLFVALLPPTNSNKGERHLKLSQTAARLPKRQVIAQPQPLYILKLQIQHN